MYWYYTYRSLFVFLFACFLRFYFEVVIFSFLRFVNSGVWHDGMFYAPIPRVRIGLHMYAAEQYEFLKSREGMWRGVHVTLLGLLAIQCRAAAGACFTPFLGQGGPCPALGSAHTYVCNLRLWFILRSVAWRTKRSTRFSWLKSSYNSYFRRQVMSTQS